MKRVKSADDLRMLLDLVGQDIIEAKINLKLHDDLLNELTEKEMLFNQSPVFWTRILTALRDSVLSRLFRIYDQYPSALSLGNLILTNEARIMDFESEAFKGRLIGNPFAEELAKSDRMPKPEVITAHKNQINVENNAILKKLVIWRNNYFSHKGTALISGGSVLKDNPLGMDELREILDQAYKIFDYYYYNFIATRWSVMMVGGDDFKNTLRFTEYGLDKYLKGGVSATLILGQMPGKK